jgi:Nif-specific regulatory protein
VLEYADGRQRDGSPLRPFLLDPDLAAEVTKERVGVLANSLESTRVSAAAAPLTSADTVHGILYADAQKGNLADGDLQLLTALGSVAGLALDSISRWEELHQENARLKENLDLQHAMIGESSAMRRVYDTIAKVARGDATVLILGENGTGKELAAHAIHSNSPRAEKPFVAVNCAALSESLLESELFGHEKGSFTGAIAQKKGKFEVADTGTIFLDEVGELAPSVQARLLRVLQEREFDRVGGTKTIKVNVRVIAATNRDLKAEVKAGTFRQDLYFRLNVVSLTMPPLRDRREDIPLLSNYFVALACAKVHRRVTGISNEARDWLLQYQWPGNVRELQNAIERAVVMGATDAIIPGDLPESILEGDAPTQVNVGKYHEIVNDAKRNAIRRALEQAGGVQTEAAKILGIHPVYLNRMIRTMKLK